MLLVCDLYLFSWFMSCVTGCLLVFVVVFVVLILFLVLLLIGLLFGCWVVVLYWFSWCLVAGSAVVCLVFLMVV